MEEVKAASGKFKEVAETLGKNYVAALVTQAFIPAIQDGLNGLVDEAKEALGKVEEKEEDLLPEDKDEKERDTFLVEIDSQKKCWTWDFHFMAYSTFVIRIGSKQEKDEKKFYVNAQQYWLQYDVIKRAPDLVNKDFKDLKAPAFPPKYEFGGSYCICLTKAPGDENAHMKAVQDYYKNLAAKLPGYSSSLAKLYKVDDDWEARQVTYQVFLEAFSNTCNDLGVREMKWQVRPFMEKEFLVALLQGVAEKDILPGVEAKLPAGFARNQARAALLTAVEAAAAPWDSVSDKANDAATEVTKKVQEGAGKIVDALREPLAKILKLVQDKMAEKAAGKEEKDEGKAEDDGKKKIGDIAKAWTFTATPIGKQLDGSLDGKMKPSEAVKGVCDAIKTALSEAVRGPVQKIADSISFGGGVSNPWVVWYVRRCVERLTQLILELTTLDGFLESGTIIAGVIDGVEDSLGKCADKDAVTKAINQASHDLWEKGTAQVAMALWTRIWKLTERVEWVMSSQCDEAKAPLTELLSHIFEVQLRAFNGIRIQYIRNLRESADEIKDADSAVRASRAAFKAAVFPVINLLGYHHWLRATSAFEASVKAIIKNAFDSEVWPSIKSGLDAIQSCIPDELTSMGLKLEPLVRAVVDFLINKALTWAITKVFMALEKALFTQGGGGGGYD